MFDALARHRLGGFAIIFCALVLRLQGLDWDQGRGLHPDEDNLVRAALELKWPNHWLPQFHAYNDLALWLPRWLSWLLCQDMSGACVRWAARLASALFSTIAVAAMGAIAGHLAGRKSAIATWLLAGFSAPLVQWAHFGTTESALVCCIALLWLQAVRWLQGLDGSWRMVIVSALLLGVGFGMKTTALAAAAIPLCAVVVSPRRSEHVVRMLLSAAVLALLVASMAAPSIWGDSSGWLASMRFENAVVNGATNVFWTRQFAHVPAGYLLKQLWTALIGVGIFFACAGFLLLPSRNRKGMAAGLVFAVLYAALASRWYAAFFRYLAPLFPALIVLAGIGVAQLLSLNKFVVIRALTLSGLLFFVVHGLDWAASYQTTDPRVQGEGVLARRAKASDTIAVEPYDMALTGRWKTMVLPLESRDPAELAQALARSDWMLIASRRNWAVLPHIPSVAPLACGYYTALARGDLGWRRIALLQRFSPLGSLTRPGLLDEETRTVFDRPEVILWRNEDKLSASELTKHLTRNRSAIDCAPATLAAAWRQVQ